MNNDSNNLNLDDELSLVNDELVSAYLRENTDFFQRNPSVLQSLKLTDTSRGVVSLVERQQQLQRQKIYALEDEITQLLQTAHHNEQLFSVYNALYLRLLDSADLNEFLDHIEQTMQYLNLARVKLYLLDAEVDSEHPCMLSTDCSAIISKRLSHDDYYFGRLDNVEKSQLFDSTEAASVALVKLTDADRVLGFLAFSSVDADHFNPTVDTLLLEQFRTLVAKLLLQQLAKLR
ncbi:DUF484 family protein [Thalassotalea ponticola]|uniref:DUF484 family protein n=1 Tax=Thalassotalea ponticola TaxID=1523392 RepID=UPI0025B3DC8A|nr:DUF484 family protein [Thalassotalea ponticola]MDN3652780.1 DUF484 family protein [Thalassotalea ponticola]